MCTARRPRPLLGLLLLCMGCLLAATGAPAGAQEEAPRVLGLEIEGVVDPFVADYIEGRIDEAGDVDAVLVTIDTPGGLDSSMRQIVQAISNASVPVVCYVAPSGARAASAGSIIMLACPVAAMAPGTNIGAATPVGLSGAIASKKAVEDAAAYAIALAEENDRNAAWAEQAVRDGVSASAEQALDLGVIDLIAPTTEALFDEIDGRAVPVGDGATATLRTAGAEITHETLGPFIGFLHALLDPNIAFVFFWLGLGLMILEFFLPHFGVAGVVGFVLLLLSVAAFGMLPVRLVGIVLLVAAAVLLVLEINSPGFGVFGIGGVAGLVIGGLLLFNGPGVRVSPAVIVVVAAGVVGFFGFVVTAAMKLRTAPPAAAATDVVGAEGHVVRDLAPEGVVLARGEEWSAVSAAGPLPTGTLVRVVRKDGLRVTVEAIGPSSGGTPGASTEKEGSAP